MTFKISMRRRWALALCVLAATWAQPAAAHADPITTAIVTAIGLTGAAATVATFVVNAAFQFAAGWGLSKLSGAKGATASQERQAQVTTLTVGEVPREMIVGEAGTGGSLVDGYYYGGANGTDWNLLVIALADHPCHALTGFYVGDTYVAFGGDGAVTGYNGQLKVWWRPGAATDAPFPSEISGLGPATADGALRGVAKVAVAYKADAADSKSPVWTSGRPSFLWVVKGALCYDPRKDDTVEGGDGIHRWDEPATWEWTDNAEICRYAYARGVYALNAVDDPTKLRLGRGLTAYEAPPERVFAAANLCDELVDIGDDQVEARYRVGGVIRASETFDRVEQMFADAMGGYIIQPEGGVAVDPGQARTPAASITDDDLIVGAPVRFSQFRSASDRVNTVVPRYVEPSQKWADTAATVCRDLTDVTADGAPFEETFSLPLVTSRAQAERLGEQRRRQHRLERTASLTLGPRFSRLEEGDWIEWTSARHTGGQPVIFRATAYGLDQAWRNTLSLEETHYDVFGFGGLPSTVTPATPSVPPGALTLSGVTAVAISLAGADDELIPAIRFGWTTPVDPAVTIIRAEIRAPGGTTTAQTTTTAVNDGEMTATNGVPANALVEVRLVPLGGPGRAIVPSSWITLATGRLVASDTLSFGDFTAAQIIAFGDLATSAEAAARDAQLRILDQISKAQRREIDLIKLLTPPSGRPPGATLDEQIRQVETATETIAEHYVEMTAGLGDAAAGLALESLTRATEDTALANYQIALAAVVDGNYSDINSSLTTLTTSQAATALALTNLTSSFNSNAASVSSSLGTLTTNLSATSAALTSLTSSFDANVASVSSQLTSITSVNSAQSSSITSLSSTVGTNTSSITTISTALATLSGQVGAAFGVRLDVNGHTIGYQGINNGFVGGWVFSGDYFAIAVPGDIPRYPFYVSGDTVYLTNTRIHGNLTIDGTLDAPQLAPRAATSTARSNGSSTINGTGGFQTILSHYVYLAKAGTVDATGTISQHFPSGDRAWELELYIDGDRQFRAYGANAQDAVPLSGSKECAAGNRLVEVIWSSHSSVNVDYRNLTSMGSW